MKRLTAVCVLCAALLALSLTGCGKLTGSGAAGAAIPVATDAAFDPASLAGDWTFTVAAADSLKGEFAEAETVQAALDQNGVLSFDAGDGAEAYFRCEITETEFHLYGQNGFYRLATYTADGNKMTLSVYEYSDGEDGGPFSSAEDALAGGEAEQAVTETTGAQDAESGSLRLDGFYQSEPDSTDARNVLRFYDDGTLLKAYIDCDPEKNPGGDGLPNGDWFNRGVDNVGVSTGSYTVTGSEISFTTSGENGSVDYVGTVGEDSLVLTSHSNINGTKRVNVGYRFIPFSDAPDYVDLG